MIAIEAVELALVLTMYNGELGNSEQRQAYCAVVSRTWLAADSSVSATAILFLFIHPRFIGSLSYFVEVCEGDIQLDAATCHYAPTSARTLYEAADRIHIRKLEYELLPNINAKRLASLRLSLSVCLRAWLLARSAITDNEIRSDDINSVSINIAIALTLLTSFPAST